MRNDTFLTTRRCYLLFSIIFSLIYPTINISPVGIEPLQYLFREDIIISANQNTEINSFELISPSITWKTIIVLIIVLTSITLLIRFLIQLFALYRLKRNNDITISGNVSIIKIENQNNSSFSFFNWIFINIDEKMSEIEEIIAHEKEHAKQIHSFDVIVSELLYILLWWLPFAKLLKIEIKTNLEFLADRGVLQKGYNTRSYQYTLLRASNKNIGIPIINNFNVSQLKKRITMMNKNKTSASALLKYLFILPIVGGLLLVNCSSENTNNLEENNSDIELNGDNNNITSVKETKSENTAPYAIVDQMPSFPGGEEAMLDFIIKNLKYPITAQNKSIQGRVVIRFVVSKTGTIRDVEVLRGIYLDCDNEAKKVVESMPNWIPGKQDGTPVDTYFTLPIQFKLYNSEKEEPQLNTINPAITLFVVNGEIVDKTDFDKIDQKNIISVNVIKDNNEIMKKYKNQVHGKTSVIEVTTVK